MQLTVYNLAGVEMKPLATPEEVRLLNEKLKRARVSKCKVARHFGVTRQYISGMLNGRMYPLQEHVVSYIQQLPVNA